jgi:hypothetical protein
MGSAPEARYCVRGEWCVRYDSQTGKPEKLSRYNKNDICERCQKEHAAGYKFSRTDQWKEKVREAIEAICAKKPASQRSGKASLWDLFKLDSTLQKDKPSERGEVLSRLDGKTLAKLRDWLEENRDRAVERYGYYTWLRLRTEVGLQALFASLPPKMRLLPDKKDGLPFQVGAVRVDGKTWDLNLPIRAELLRRLPRYFSERDYAKLLRIKRGFYRKMRARMDREGFPLRKFTTADLEAIVRGKKRGRPPKSQV